MKKTLILFSLIYFILVACETQPSDLQINQITNNNNEVVLRYGDNWNTFWAINIPFQFEITNNSSTEGKFTTCYYIYNNQLGRHSKLYLLEGTTFKSVSPNKLKNITKGDKKRYVIYSQHVIDTSKYKLDFFKPYLDELKGSNQDTLLVGTLEEFKLKHPEFIKDLIEGDSLDFEFLTTDFKFEKPVKIPVAW